LPGTKNPMTQIQLIGTACAKGNPIKVTDIKQE
jgi:hypothetical protein